MTPVSGGSVSSAYPMMPETISSETSSPASITALALRPVGVPSLTAVRSMSPVDNCVMPRSETRRCACVPLPAPGGPSKMIFMAFPYAPGLFWLSQPALEPRLLDEIAILMRNQVALDLGHGVHRHVDHDQQAGSAQIEGNARPRDQELGDQADDRKISRADHRDAGEDIVEIILGVLARPDA